MILVCLSPEFCECVQTSGIRLGIVVERHGIQPQVRTGGRIFRPDLRDVRVTERDGRVFVDVLLRPPPQQILSMFTRIAGLTLLSRKAPRSSMISSLDCETSAMSTTSCLITCSI